MSENIEVDILVIGAGIVGLSVANSLVKLNKKLSVALVERHSKFGQEISSRNSEVIHAGVYYPRESLKAATCIRGKELLYDYLLRHNIQYKQCGKLIIASTVTEEQKLLSLYNNGLSLNVPLKVCDSEEIFDKTGLINQFRALWSPTSGIFNTHMLMNIIECEIKENGGMISYSTDVKDVDIRKGKLAITCHSKDQVFNIFPGLVINCGGLNSANIHKVFFPESKFKIVPCRGHYYMLNQKYRNRFNTLVYPIPTGDGGLGVHITIDCEGYAKLGPDVEWLYSSQEDVDSPEILDFNIDESRKVKFFNAGLKLIPELQLKDLQEGYVGLRPKLIKENELQNDFLIDEGSIQETKVVSLLGIESPGLTAAMGLAEKLCKQLI